LAHLAKTKVLKMSRKIRKNIRENVGALDDKTKIFKNFKIT
jgi:hypothetical protein